MTVAPSVNRRPDSCLILYFLLLFQLGTNALHAQISLSTGQKQNKRVEVIISGYIYDTHAGKNPVTGAMIRTLGGRMVRSDKAGYYQIQVLITDSVQFYNPKDSLIAVYPATYLQFYHLFNVYLEEREFFTGHENQGHELQTVKVTGRDYKKDSAMLRYLYSDIFNYKKPTLGDAIKVPKIGKVPIPLAIGVSVSGLVLALQNKKKNKEERMKRFALYAEDEGYIQNRLSSHAIELYTGIQNEDSINYLRLYYRPTAARLREMNELELGQYLIEQAHAFRIGKLPVGAPAFTRFLNSWEAADGKDKDSTVHVLMDEPGPVKNPDNEP